MKKSELRIILDFIKSQVNVSHQRTDFERGFASGVATVESVLSGLLVGVQVEGLKIIAEGK